MAAPELLGFASRHNHSFIMKFENGLKVSVCWGRKCYCDRYEFGTNPVLDLEEEIVTSPNAEIAVSQNGILMCWGIDTVAGEMTPDQVGLIIGLVQSIEDMPENLVKLVHLGLAPNPVHTGRLEMIRRKLVELGLATDPVSEIGIDIRLTDERPRNEPHRGA